MNFRTAVNILGVLSAFVLFSACYDDIAAGATDASSGTDAAGGRDAASERDAAAPGDAAINDTGDGDGGQADAGAPDADAPDAANPQDAGGETDAGVPDAETPDAGQSQDAGGGDDTGVASQLGKLGPEIFLFDGRNPDIAADSKGDPHIVFDRKGVGVFYVKGNGTSGGFPAAPVALGSAKAIEPRIFIDENDDVHAVWALSPTGSNIGGTEGWYTNNIGGAWKAPIKVAAIGDGDTGDGGLTRITCGRVIKAPGADVAVTSWSGEGSSTVLVSVEGLAGTPAVKKKLRIVAYIPGLVALSSTTVRTVYRTGGGEKATDYSLDLQPSGTFDVLKIQMSGECGDGFIDRKTGTVHYTGTAAGDSHSRVWYTNDDRIAQNKPILGMETAELGATGWFWADVCVDVRGHAYVTHSYIDTDNGACTAAKCNGYAAYVEGDTLVSVLIAPGYKGLRVGPYCAPTATGGIHVVYHLNDEIFYRTVGVP